MLEQLRRYYQGELTSLDEEDDAGGRGGAGAGGSGSGEEDGDEARRRSGADAAANADGDAPLLSERLAPRKGLPPLLVPLSDRKPDRLHYLGERCVTGVLGAMGARGFARLGR